MELVFFKLLPRGIISFDLVGAKVLAGEKQIDIDKHTRVNVNMRVENLSFSAHADAKGIMQLIRNCEPKNVILVHGELNKMNQLKKRIHNELGIPTYNPANGMNCVINTGLRNTPVKIPVDVIREGYEAARSGANTKISFGSGDIYSFSGSVQENSRSLNPVTEIECKGSLVYDPTTKGCILTSNSTTSKRNS